MLEQGYGRLGFVGAGSMAEALIAGLITAGVVSPDAITVTNKSNQARLEGVARRWGVHTTRHKAELVRQSDVIILATKPADIPVVLAELTGLVKDQLIISVAAGISCGLIEKALGPGIAVIRAMPNTSSWVKESATALALGRWANADHEKVATIIFASVGKVVSVPEECLDAVTAVSGSGPAYVYLLMEALAEAGMRAGLAPEVSRLLSQQTVLGAARMVQETGEDPSSLRRKVTSPNGTTMAALRVLEEMRFGLALEEAVKRAAERAREMREEISAGLSDVAAKAEPGSAAGAAELSDAAAAVPQRRIGTALAGLGGSGGTVVAPAWHEV